MSKNYNLRNRTATGTALQPNYPQAASPESAHRLYSDVVASRPPSPIGDRANVSAAVGRTDVPKGVSGREFFICRRNFFFGK
jgi:hypothetical protein